MLRLSSLIEDIQDHYTVVVIGSGYGGGIAASRMARAGQSVCILERGKEFQPGEYPDTDAEALREMQVRTPEATAGSKTGLYDFVVGNGINVFLGCGLGGRMPGGRRRSGRISRPWCSRDTTAPERC
jgi:cholesterol oxidase